jgi:hypothetical protein
MKARDIFGILVRGGGLLVFLDGLWNLAFAVCFTFGLLGGTSHDNDYLGYYAFGIPAVFIGILLVRYARSIVRFGYPKDKEDSDS